MDIELRESNAVVHRPSQRSSEERRAPPEAPEAPPNGGWHAWLQVFSASFLVFNSCFAISWIGTVQAFLLILVGVITGPVYDRGYCRLLIASGAFFIFLGLLMTSFATEYPQILLAQGILVGLGLGCLYVPGVAIVASYFSTRRAVAVGLASAGGSVSGVIYVIAFRRLQPRIGFGWATRIIAFIALTTLLANLVMTKTRTKPGPARTLLDLKAFKSARYTLFTAGATVALIGLYFPYFYIPIYSERIVGTSADFAFYLLAVLNAASIFGRIVPNFLADRIGPLNVLIPCTFIISGLIYAWIGIKNTGGIVAFTIFYGFFSGSFLSLMPTVVASLSPDPRSYGTRMGMSFGIGSFGVLIGNPIAGKILNVSEGKFAGAQYFAASTTLAGAVLFLMARLSMVGKIGHKVQLSKIGPRRWYRLEERRHAGGVLRNYSVRPE
ncbi:MAG: hypothetical protein Q9191_005732 [Dirinaria sp. TL-2023a]